jgi:hypothetical protein
MSWIKRAWRWSRTVFLNVMSLVGAGIGELLNYLLGANWASVIDNPRMLFWWLLAMNVVNILLRLDTRGPVGQKDQS